MIYAIQGASVRWFLAPEEESHLFSLFDLKDATAEIKVSGNWNEGLVFKPVIYKSRRSPNIVNGSFALESLIAPGDLVIKTITTPIDYLKIARTSLSTLRPSANILCRLSKQTRELTLYPTQILDADVSKPEVVETTNFVETLGEEPSSEVHAALSEDPQDFASDPSEGITGDDLASESEGIIWVKEVVAEINGILASHPEITVSVGETGKNVKFVRRVITRRTIA